MGTANKIIWNVLKKELNQALNMLVKESNSSERVSKISTNVHFHKPLFEKDFESRNKKAIPQYTNHTSAVQI